MFLIHVTLLGTCIYFRMTVNFFVLLVLTNINSNNNFYYLLKQILVENYTLTLLKISAFYLLGYVS